MTLLKSLTLILLLLVASMSFGKKYSRRLPKDPSQLPSQIQKEITAIANLCYLDTRIEKINKLKVILENLAIHLEYYTSLNDNHNYLTRSGLWRMMALYGHSDMSQFWDSLFSHSNSKNMNFYILQNYLDVRASEYYLPSSARNINEAPHWFLYQWEHDVYKGFYCIDFSTPPSNTHKSDRHKENSL